MIFYKTHLKKHVKIFIKTVFQTKFFNQYSINNNKNIIFFYTANTVIFFLAPQTKKGAKQTHRLCWFCGCPSLTFLRALKDALLY
jgi:hypothetical protein